MIHILADVVYSCRDLVFTCSYIHMWTKCSLHMWPRWWLTNDFTCREDVNQMCFTCEHLCVNAPVCNPRSWLTREGPEFDAAVCRHMWITWKSSENVPKTTCGHSFTTTPASHVKFMCFSVMVWGFSRRVEPKQALLFVHHRTESKHNQMF